MNHLYERLMAEAHLYRNTHLLCVRTDRGKSYKRLVVLTTEYIDLFQQGGRMSDIQVGNLQRVLPSPIGSHYATSAERGAS